MNHRTLAARGSGFPSGKAAKALLILLALVGAVVVYRPGPAYSVFGHVAIVIATQAGSYTVSEMNFMGEGRVDTRTVSWPDPNVSGFIPLEANG